MSNGGLIGKLNQTTDETASGVWRLNEILEKRPFNTWPLQVNADPYWSDVRLLMRFDNNLTDLSGYTTPTLSGTMTYTTVDKKFGTHAANFSSGAFLNVAATNNTVFQFGTGSWTVECWVYTTAYLASGGNRNIFSWNRRLVNAGSGPLSFGVTGGTSSQLWKPFWYDDNIGAKSHSTAFANGAWNHIACCKDGNNLYLCLNGVTEYMGTTNRDFNDTNGGTQIRNNAYNETGWAAIFDEFRVTRGVARYTSNYTVPQTRFANF